MFKFFVLFTTIKKKNNSCLLPFLPYYRRPGSVEEAGLCSERGSGIQDKNQL